MDTDNKYGLKECQEKLLLLMSTFDKMCQENGIVYCADSGTLLGAIRHNGFIPWDDDLDVAMDRKNYEKLMAIDFNRYDLKYVRKFFIESFCLLNDDSETDHRPILDVFTLDNTPDNFFIRKLKIMRILYLHGLWHYYSPNEYNGKSFFGKIYSFVFRKLGSLYKEESIFKRLQKISKSGNNKKTKCVQGFDYLTYELHVVYPSDILNDIKRHKFESIEINIPQKYDIYLTNLYGDYMTPVITKEKDKNLVLD